MKLPPQPRPIFIIGAQRSGTSWLRSWLASVPGIVETRTITPEPRILKSAFLGDARNWRDRYFGPAWREFGTTHVLEKSTSHLEQGYLASAVMRHAPQSAVIVILREPIERAISHYRFSLGNGLENLGIEEAFTLDASLTQREFPQSVSVNPFAYLTRGLYGPQLRPWLRAIPSANILVLTTNELFSSIVGFNRVTEMLGIAKVPAPPQPGRLSRNGSTSAKVPPGLVAKLRDRYGYFFESSNRELEQMRVNISSWKLENRSIRKLALEPIAQADITEGSS